MYKNRDEINGALSKMSQGGDGDKPKTKPPESIPEIQALIAKHYLNPGSKSEVRTRLEEGLQMVKNRIEYNTKLNEEMNLNLNVDSMDGWFHNLIRDKLMGKLEGTLIVWKFPERKITWDPMSGNFNESQID